MVIIRADGNPQIGSGHIMRCLTIAHALKEFGIEAKFLLADETMKSVVEGQGFLTECLHTLFTNMEEELPNLTRCISKEDIVIIDSYYVTKNYLDIIGKICKVIYIDDLMELPTSVDYLINYNCYAKESLYKELPQPKHEALFGAQYVPLRTEFSGVAYEVKETCKHILITTGGGDNYNIGGQLVEKLCALEEMKEKVITIVVGGLSPHLGMLQELSKRYENLVVMTNVKNMSELMASCDLAISAAGSTLYELCAVGVPTIAFSFAKNQEPGILAMGEMNVLVAAGQYHLEGEQVLDQIVKETLVLCQDQTKRYDLHKTSKCLVDGQGANRIAKAIETWCEKGK